MEVRQAVKLKAFMEKEIKEYIDNALNKYESETGIRPWAVDVSMLAEDGGKFSVDSVELSINL